MILPSNQNVNKLTLRYRAQIPADIHLTIFNVIPTRTKKGPNKLLEISIIDQAIRSLGANTLGGQIIDIDMKIL